jgi:hypothetical protein
MSSDPVPQSPWIVFLTWLERVVKENWSGLAMILWGYEEKKVEGAKQETETAKLNEALVENENQVLKEFAGKSDSDILHQFGDSTGHGSSDSDTK